MNKITDIELYNTQMSHSMKDKLFFLDFINPKEANTIVDFGCANGELLKQLPYDWNKIGIDNSKEMIDAAIENCDAAYFSSLDEIDFFDKNNAVLNMSSVIHEIYSYLNEKEIAHFWDKVFNSGYKYITIRDMMVSNKTNRDMSLNELRTICAHRKVNLFRDFHKVYPQWRARDMLHFFMKYRYTENWDRERDENYFPITIEELTALIPDNYEIVYQNAYILQWTKDRVLKDFGYEIEDNTHIKLILKKKKHID